MTRALDSAPDPTIARHPKDANPTDPLKDKNETIRRFLKGMKHHRTHEERKQIKQHSRERRDGQAREARDRRDWRTWDEDDEDDLFEKFGRTERLDLEAAKSRADPGRVADPDLDDIEFSALVLSVGRGRATLALGGVEVEARLSRDLASTQRTSVAVGDRAAVDELEDGSFMVEAIAPRASVLSRPDPQNPHLERTIAANVDVGVIVVAARSTELRLGIVDRIWLALERGGVRPVVCVNKIDLFDQRYHLLRAEELVEPYREAGLTAHLVSASSGVGIEALAAELRGRTTVFVGQSGVGKSSLLNAIDPEGGRVVSEVRDGDGKGRHTTTSSSLVELGDGTRVIDTPGVRQFGLWDLEAAELAALFPEFDELPPCRFGDCTHTHEPDCTVRAAAEDGRLPEVRYGTYRRIRDSLE